MCRRHWLYDDIDEDLACPIHSARPRLMWAMPVSMSELGASIEAYSDTIPQTSTLRLCHRFSSNSLSQLPQEIIEQIISEIRRYAYDEIAPGWHHDFLCFQGRCTLVDHYHSYGEHTEKLIDCIYEEDRMDLTKAQKVEIVREFVVEDPMPPMEDDIFDLHDEAQERYIRRTCLCLPESNPSGFGRFNKLLKSQFGLEVVIMHEIVDETLRRFLPTLDLWLEYGHLTIGDKVSYTLCYLTLASDTSEGYIVGGRTEPAAAKQFCRQGDHRAFQQIIDPSLLTLTERHRLRFKKAMRVLDISPCYHLSELEAHVKHPIRDKALSRLCSCSEDGCEPANYIDEQEKADSFDKYLDDKSKELLKEPWPKLMVVAASDAVAPCPHM